MSQETTPKPKGGWKTNIFVSAVVMIVGFAAVGYVVWRGQQQEIAFMAQKITPLKQMWVQQNQRLQEQDKLIKKLQENQQKARLHQEANWVLAEVDYLVNLAAFNLRIENNISLARQVLQAADQKIAMLNDPRLLPVREALGMDLAALNAVPTSDVAGWVIYLNALSKQMDALPRIPRISSQPRPASVHDGSATAPMQTSSGQERWKQVLTAVAETLKSLFVIHYQEGNTPVLLTPDQYPFIITNIQSQLALAQWAVVHHQPQVYQQSLERARSWIAQYFPNDHFIVQMLVQKLRDLQKISVKSPSLPDLNRSIEAVKKISPL